MLAEACSSSLILTAYVTGDGIPRMGHSNT